MKQQTNLNVEITLKQKAKALGINMSDVMNNVLRGIISQYDNSDINMFEIEKELELIHKNISDLKVRQIELLAQKISFEEKRKQAEDKDLKEKIKMSKAIKASGIL